MATKTLLQRRNHQQWHENARKTTKEDPGSAHPGGKLQCLDIYIIEKWTCMHWIDITCTICRGPTTCGCGATEREQSTRRCWAITRSHSTVKLWVSPSTTTRTQTRPVTCRRSSSCSWKISPVSSPIAREKDFSWNSCELAADRERCFLFFQRENRLDWFASCGRRTSFRIASAVWEWRSWKSNRKNSQLETITTIIKKKPSNQPTNKQYK